MLLPLTMVLSLVGAAQGSFCDQDVQMFPDGWPVRLPRNAHFLVVPSGPPPHAPDATSEHQVELRDQTTGERLPIHVERIEDGHCLALRVRPVNLLTPEHALLIRAPAWGLLEEFSVADELDHVPPGGSELVAVDWRGFSVRAYSSGVHTWGEDAPPTFRLNFHEERGDERVYHEVQLLREDGSHSSVLPLVGWHPSLWADPEAPSEGMTAALREIVATGEPVRLRARPVDVAGNRGEWSESGTLRVPLGPLDWEHPDFWESIVGIANLHATYIMTLLIAIGIGWCFILNTAIVREQPRRWGYARPGHRRWALPRRGAARTRAQAARTPGEAWQGARTGWREALGVLRRAWVR